MARSLLDAARQLRDRAPTHHSYVLGADLVGAGAGMAPPRTPASRPMAAQRPSSKPTAAKSDKASSAASNAAKQASGKRVLPRKPGAAAMAGKSPHLRAARVSKSSAQRAATAGARALRVAQNKPAPTRVHGAVAVGLAHTLGHDVYEITGHDAFTIVGAATSKAKAKLTPKQRAAVARHEAAVAKSTAASVRAAKAGNASIAASKTLSDQLSKVSPKIAKLFAWRGTTVLGHDFFEIVGDDEPVVDDTAPTDDANAGSPDPTVPVVYTMQNDPNVTPLPVRGGTLSPEDAAAVWQHVPEDGIPYDGSVGWPRYSKGSYIYYYGPIQSNRPGLGKQGFIYGYDKMGWPSSKDPVRWIWRYGQNDFGGDNWSDGFRSDAAVAAASASKVWNLQPYGPLIGDPNNPQYAGLQYAVADDKWFWQSANAPKWATAEADAAIALLNQKILDADNKAAQAEAAAAAKEKADREAEAARQAAEQALAEQAAESERRVTESKSSAQDTATQSALNQAVSQLDQQAAKMQLAAQQSQLDWLKQNGMPALDLSQYGSYALPSMQQGYGGDFVDENGVPTPPTYRGDSDLASAPSVPGMPDAPPSVDEFFADEPDFAPEIPQFADDLDVATPRSRALYDDESGSPADISEYEE